MAVVGIYRRPLPSPPAIDFSSSQGKQLFSEALHGGTLEGFFKLISYYQTQSEPAFCGLASLSMVLNSLSIDPGRTWKGPWRWFDDSMLDCCEPLSKIKSEGITFGKVACLAHCNGAKVQTFRTNDCTLDDFRHHVISCTSSEDCHLVVSYHRKAFQQTGTGHFSPIGGYHRGKDMVLILDVARFKYPPHWVPLELLWQAMDTIDEATGRKRGFMIISRLHRTPASVLYTVNCKSKDWNAVSKYLIEDLPQLLETEGVKDVNDVFSVLFKSSPGDVRTFVKWVAEVRRPEDGGSVLSEEEKESLAIKEELLKQARKTELFKHVLKWLDTTFSCHKDSLPEIAANVCCQGARLLTGNFSSSDDMSFRKAAVKFSTRDGEKSARMVSGTVISNGTEQGIEVLVPSCCTEPTGSHDPHLNGCNEMHPTTADVLTVLVFSLPQHTWSGIIEENLRARIDSLVSADSLPPLLQEEVLHLRRQLQFVMNDDDDVAIPA